ncbi:MAG TPA: sigma-54 dependent transcriptional regulator [Candidatus Binatia bacterium]|jgi:DNA-binding NtrC family response regulator|nr:sigma-54 dependent transcriptional regulator [Candidatus Binatia bacterium]
MSDKILVVDDELSNRKILEQELTYKGYAVETANGGSEALKKVESSRPDLLILDYMMPDLSGLEVLKELRKREDDTPVVMITAYGTVERAVEAMREGAYDFITRPFEPDHIALVVQKALERQNLKREVEVLSEEVGQRHRLIVGESLKMSHAANLAKKVAASNATVMLLGESGTGKEIFARSIHNWSERKDKPFLTINCVGLSKELLESELFGHEQGAFTGAHQRKRGKLELAHGGTVFFDEIGDISQELQAKLLRFLQEREFERVGGIHPISVDVRIIAATNRNLEAALEKGLFREDLYHRLNVVAVSLPPLRERKEDIPILSQYFLRKYSTATRKKVNEITREAMERLVAYNWPGNVRELANVIERAVVLGSSPTLGLGDLPNRIVSRETPASSDSLSYRDGMNVARKQLILKALAATQGNRSAAAKVLGLEAKYLLKLMKSLRIE